MLSFLYLNEERIRSTYSQTSDSLQTKMTKEKSQALEGTTSAGLWELFKSSVKGSKGSKTTTETVKTTEHMLQTLLDSVRDGLSGRALIAYDDWDGVKQGDLVLFRGNLEFDSYGLSKPELWEASYEDLGQRKTRHDLRLKGPISGHQVEIPFSPNWVTGPSQFAVLCHANFEHLEGLAIIIGSPLQEPIVFQPLAFGNGFVDHEG